MEGVEEEEGVYLLGGAAGRNASNTKLFQKTGEEKKKWNLSDGVASGLCCSSIFGNLNFFFF